MNNEILILIGISGSGKTTFATKFIKENLSYLRINRDDIRKTLVGNLDGYYQRNDLNNIEIEINALEYEMFDSLIYKYKIIIDNTNLKQKYIYKWLELCFENHIDFKFKLFDCDLREARKRVAEREQIGRMFCDGNTELLDYINKQYKDYQLIKKYILKTYPDNIL